MPLLPPGVHRKPLAPLVAHQAVERRLLAALPPDSHAAKLAQYLKIVSFVIAIRVDWF